MKPVQVNESCALLAAAALLIGESASCQGEGAAPILSHYIQRTTVGSSSIIHSSTALNLIPQISESATIAACISVSLILLAIFAIRSILIGWMLKSKAGDARSLNRYTPALAAAVASVCVMCAFEVAKMYFSPNIWVWSSHAITIVFTSMMVGFIAFFLLKREARIHREAAATEERYKLLFERSLAGAYLSDVDGRILDCNVSFCRTLGYSEREELIGESFDRIYPSTVELGAFRARLEDERVLTNFEQELKRKDGSTVWVLHSAALVSTEHDLKQVIRGTVADLTARRAAEQKERRLAAIVRCSTYAMYAMTPDGIIETWNRGAERIFGYSAEEVIGRSVGVLAPPDKSSEFLQILETAGGGRDLELETTRITKDGRLIAVALSVAPIKDTSGIITGVEVILRDITDRKRAEEALAKSEIQYRLLFDRNPIPMWAFDRQTLRFLSVNKAAVRQYGFSEQEFLQMTIAEIRPEDAIADMLADVAKRRSGLQKPGAWKHRRKDGSIIDVEIICHDLVFQGIDAMLVAAYDVTERNKSHEAARQAEEKYRGIFDNAVVGIFQLTPEGLPLSVNRAYAKMHGYDSPEQFLAEVSDIGQQILADPQGMMHMHAQLSQGDVRNVEVEVYRRDRTQTWMRVNLRAVRDETGNIKSFEGTIEDIDERKRAQEALLFKTALLEAQSETTIDGILAVDEVGSIVLANKQFGDQFGVPSELRDLQDDHLVLNHVMNQVEDPDAFIERVKYLYSHRDEKGRDEIKLKDGRTLDRYSAPLIDSHGQLRGRIWYFRDITERKTAVARAEYLAYYDALTCLPNATHLQDRLSEILANARKTHKEVALLFLDLDRFKLINDSLGRTVGDLLLKDVADRLKRCIRGQQDAVARVGGDEFVIVLSGVNAPSDAVATAKRIVDSVAESFVIHGYSLSTSCSVGISLFPDHASDFETLLKYADQAMSCAKANGRNRFEFFSDDLNRQAVEHLNVDGALRLGLEKEEFFLVYQPQMEISSGEITGFEALIRWQHPELGLVPPDRFIPIAEKNGLILPIGEWVLRTACNQAKRWYDHGLLTGPVAVNVSAVQFREQGFCDLIKTVLHETGLPPHFLELELTESLLVSDADVVASVLKELRSLGVRLSIDDFGTGYSSLSYLKRFHVDKLKIDRSFIKDLATDSDDAAIATAIISMAKQLHLKVIAEGVDDEAQLEFLREHQCDEIQGYYFCRPIPGAEIEDKLRRIQAGKRQSRQLLAAASANSLGDRSASGLTLRASETELENMEPNGRFVN